MKITITVENDDDGKFTAVLLVVSDCEGYQAYDSVKTPDVQHDTEEEAALAALEPARVWLAAKLAEKAPKGKRRAKAKRRAARDKRH